MRGDSLWEIVYHQRKECGAKDAALRGAVSRRLVMDKVEPMRTSKVRLERNERMK